MRTHSPSPAEAAAAAKPGRSALGAAGTGLGLIVQAVGAAGVVAIAVHTTIDVVRRESVGVGVNGTLDFVTNYYMIAIVFMGLMVAQRQREHIEVNVLFDRLPINTRRSVALGGQLLTIGFVLAMANYGFLEALANMEQGERSGVTGVPIWPSRFLIPVGFLAYAVRLGVDAARDFRCPVAVSAAHDGAGESQA